MSQASFTNAVRAAIPEFEITDTPFDSPIPEGHMQLTFHARPAPDGFHLSITIGEGPAHDFTFSDEEEAAAFTGQLYASATS